MPKDELCLGQEFFIVFMAWKNVGQYSSILVLRKTKGEILYIYPCLLLPSWHGASCLFPQSRILLSSLRKPPLSRIERWLTHAHTK